MIDQGTIGFVSALSALIASIAGPLVTLYAARLQIRANVGSANRQRWVDEFRDVIANFCSEIAIAAQGRANIAQNG